MSVFSSWLRACGACTAALIIAVGLAACGDDSDSDGGGDSGSSGGGGTIALLLPETKTTRYEEQDRPNFERRVKELCKDCEVIYSNANQDPAKQQQQAEAAITKGAKVIVISAVDVASAGAIVQRAAQSDVKVIAYGRLIPDADIDYYVSIDPFKVGQQQAEVQMEALQKSGASSPKVVMINGAPTDSNAKPYKDGAAQVLKEKGAQVVKSYDTPDWSPDKAQQEMERVAYLARQGRLRRCLRGQRRDGGRGDRGTEGGRHRPGEPLRDRPGRRARRRAAHPHRRAADDGLPADHPDRGNGGRACRADRAGRRPAGRPREREGRQRREGGAVEPLDTIAIRKDNIESTLIKDGFLDVGDICTAAYRTACEEAGLQ